MIGQWFQIRPITMLTCLFLVARKWLNYRLRDGSATLSSFSTAERSKKEAAEDPLFSFPLAMTMTPGM